MDERKWWKESVVYQIYPQSFCDSNGDGIGDLGGIISKLDYLKDLGVDVLWISPIFPSPGRDNGYDISDYESIATQYGAMADFERLLEQAHERGLKVILDMVLNHTSSEHPWFKAAVCDQAAKERGYYIWKAPAPDGGPPNNWGALFGGPAWTLDKDSGKYYLHLFSSGQPDLNWGNAELRRELYSMMRRWLNRGIDGFRLDVISLIAKPEDFSDGEPGPGGYFDPRARIAATPQLHTYLREMRNEVLRGSDAVSVGEASATTLDGARLLTNPDGSELDMVFQFEHMDLDGGETFKWTDRKIPLSGLKEVMFKWQTNMEGQGWNALFWDNHDQPRMLSRLGDEGEFREMSAKMLAVCLHMLKGTPFIYQGDELGMTNMRFTSPSQLKDSESISAYRRYAEQEQSITKADMLRFIDLKSRDTARTPMQWAAKAGAGFTTSEPWMPINPNYTGVNAEEQESREDSVLAFYRQLIALRRKYDVIVYGECIPFAQEHPGVFSYLRIFGKQELLVCCNFSDKSVVFPPSKDFIKPDTMLLLGNNPKSMYMQNAALAPYEALILLNKEE